jgi:uncharacterized protein (DUF488 family)
MLLTGANMRRFFTLGHSSHTPEHFVGLLQQHGVQVVVDTRSSPYSRYSPQFDREALQKLLSQASVKYLYMGDVVGGRPRDEACYDGDGHVLYGRVAQQPEFQAAIARLQQGADEFRVALLCSEEDPAHCHRRLLISRVLIAEGAEITHIRGDGTTETDDEVASRTGKALVEQQPALFGELDEASWRSTGVIGKAAARSAIG